MPDWWKNPDESLLPERRMRGNYDHLPPEQRDWLEQNGVMPNVRQGLYDTARGLLTPGNLLEEAAGAGAMAIAPWVGIPANIARWGRRAAQPVRKGLDKLREVFNREPSAENFDFSSMQKQIDRDASTPEPESAGPELIKVDNFSDLIPTEMLDWAYREPPSLSRRQRIMEHDPSDSMMGRRRIRNNQRIEELEKELPNADIERKMEIMEELDKLQAQEKRLRRAYRAAQPPDTPIPE